jgi:hypothetical protein
MNVKGGNCLGKRIRRKRMIKTTKRDLEQLKQQKMFDEALTELKKETGVDFMKLMIGDEKERMRYKFRLWQDKMKDD